MRDALLKLVTLRTALGIVCLSMLPSLAFAGPEPDASYKFVISFSVLVAIVILLCIATGFLARVLALVCCTVNRNHHQRYLVFASIEFVATRS